MHIMATSSEYFVQDSRYTRCMLVDEVGSVASIAVLVIGRGQGRGMQHHAAPAPNHKEDS